MADLDGKVDEVKGRAKEAAGALADDPDLKAEGKVDRASGSLKDKIDDVKDKAKDAVDSVKDKVQGK
jgi:uncharacterized protein YjbJ (UPF0337 family)